ncbi:TK protein kinase, variant [Sphaeroforma arctica JP610]|nr:TK protein kinase, variant [Sphaeroforma arctica JP610]KNC85215.1 TK protein kinase, variant [Sphaeroforma arctica JP610]|eukprot:XP_014159117.1 TK protein kinase, variant [Sphaeroforma arctica JP610]
MKSLDHPNIVSMIGLSTVEHDEGICECLIMEYMGLGDLRSYIKPSTQSEDESGTIISTKYITLHEKLWHCLQIARGMEYLASVNIVHRDLAARNCMLSDPVEHTSRIVEGYEFSPGSSYPVTKIADFGLSRMFDENERQYVMSNSTLLPVRWLSIEAITDRAYTEKSDCWAFAVTCWEVFSDGAIPYQDLSTYNLAASVAAGTRLTKPAVCPLAVFDIIKSGWEQDVEKRPTFKELRQKLEGVFMTASMEYLQNNETFKGGLKSEESMAIEDPSRYEYPYTTITAPETAFLQADTDMTYLNLEDTRSPDMLLSRRDKQDDITEEAGYVVMNGAIRRPTNTQDESRGSEFRSQARGFSGDTSIYLDGNLDTAIEGVYNMYPPR